MKKTLFIVMAVTLMSQSVANASIDDLLKAIRYVETGNAVDPPDSDNNNAIGPMCIHYGFWRDALEFQPSIKGEYEDCHQLGYSIEVALAWWKRYCPKELKEENYEVLSRRFNGGPHGENKQSTIKYWLKVKKELDKN